MTLEEFNALYKLLPSLGLGILLILALLVLVLRAFFLPYLTEKAKNLATREDISVLTHKVEAIRVQYSTLIEAEKGRHQLRLAGIDRRLAAHQEAFSYWRSLYRALHTPEVNAEAGKCSEWWEQNCLYLEPEVRKAFADALGKLCKTGPRLAKLHDA